MNRPKPDEFPPAFQKYIDTVTDDVIDELETQATAFPAFIQAIPDEKAGYSYSEGKWTVKELLGHMIDTERILTYRAICFSRNDTQPLPGFEEDDYVKYAHFNDRTLAGLAEEFNLLRRANLHFFRSLQEEELSRKGLANGKPMSVRALLFVLAGHVHHHRRILSERYL
jgi:uncharacterized damage-inducible protein DinB